MFLKDNKIAGWYTIISSLIFILLSIYFFFTFKVKSDYSIPGGFGLPSFFTIIFSFFLIIMGKEILNMRLWAKVIGLILYLLIMLTWVGFLQDFVAGALIVIPSIAGLYIIILNLKNH